MMVGLWWSLFDRLGEHNAFIRFAFKIPESLFGPRVIHRLFDLLAAEQPGY
jgi:hypothetical protein